PALGVVLQVPVPAPVQHVCGVFRATQAAFGKFACTLAFSVKQLPPAPGQHELGTPTPVHAALVTRKSDPISPLLLFAGVVPPVESITNVPAVIVRTSFVLMAALVFVGELIWRVVAPVYVMEPVGLLN